MLKLNEELLQFIWQHKLLNPLPLITKSGEEIFVLKTGERNLDAGPDFFNAQIKLKEIVLAGNVEVHIKTSDWLKHGHQKNKNYDNIILHVVYEHDVTIEQNVANHVEVLELKPLIAKETLETYHELSSAKTKLPCATQLKTVSNLKFIAWMERMTIERLEEKVKRFEGLWKEFNGDYTQTFYTILLRNFGFNVNALPFELLAKQLPFQILLKHADNIMQLEALLLGMAGLLENQFEDKYIQNLQNEFEYLKNKYQLKVLNKELFKFSKLRPANFPNVRLAQFAQLMHKKSTFLLNPEQANDFDGIKNLLMIKLEGYWKNHYVLDGKTLEKELSLGETSAENIIINTFAPFFFFYSKKMAKPELSDLAIELLSKSTFEVNAKSKLFEAKKESLASAADSQAIINLYDNYCSKKSCLNCGIGVAILKT
jgi:hypothetical protein